MGRPNDPSGILARVPELEPLASDAAIHKAIEHGSAHRVYRALFWARWLGRLRDDKSKADADALLGNRRLFLEPLTGAPGMMRVNGIGTGIYGREEQGADGAYVTTLFFSVLFIPVIPLGAYLVADAGGRSYRFFGKAPLGSVSYLWGWLVLLAASCAAMFGIATSLWASQHATLYVFDGLPVPILATVGGESRTIAAGSHDAIVVGSGAQEITIATTDGARLESGTIEARAGEDVIAWNVLGAAPLFLEQIVYGSSSASQPVGPDPELACGRTDIHWGSVDYAFVEPPSTIQLRSQFATERRSHADVVPGGFEVCASLLAARARYAEAGALVLRVAQAQVTADPIVRVGLAEFALRLGATHQDVLPLLRSVRDAAPTLIDVHRAYQDAMTNVGRIDEARAEYEARAAADPSSADAAYLALRTQPAAESLERARVLTERFPDHPYSLRAYGYALYDTHQCLEALDVWERPAASGDGAVGVVPFRAACLVSLGRAQEAATLVDEESARTPAAVQYLASAYAASARAAGVLDPAIVLARIDFGDDVGERLRAAITAGFPVTRDQFTTLEGADRDLTEFYAMAGGNPDRMLELAGSLTLPSIRSLPEPLFVLVYAEACRRDPSSRAAVALAAASPLGPARDAWVRDFIATRDEAMLDELPRETRASLWAVASRGANEEDATALRARVAQDDPLASWATRSLAGWPAP